MHNLKDPFTSLLTQDAQLLSHVIRKIFEKLETFSSPVTLHGVAGDSKVTSGGVMKFDCIDTNSHVVTI